MSKTRTKKEKKGISTDFSTYITEDSYNHLRMAQVLLSANAKEGFWHSKFSPRTYRLVEDTITTVVQARNKSAMNSKKRESMGKQAQFAEFVEELKKNGVKGEEYRQKISPVP